MARVLSPAHCSFMAIVCPSSFRRSRHTRCHLRFVLLLHLSRGASLCRGPSRLSPRRHSPRSPKPRMENWRSRRTSFLRYPPLLPRVSSPNQPRRFSPNIRKRLTCAAGDRWHRARVPISKISSTMTRGYSGRSSIGPAAGWRGREAKISGSSMALPRRTSTTQNQPTVTSE